MSKHFSFFNFFFILSSPLFLPNAHLLEEVSGEIYHLLFKHGCEVNVCWFARTTPCMSALHQQHQQSAVGTSSPKFQVGKKVQASHPPLTLSAFSFRHRQKKGGKGKGNTLRTNFSRERNESPDRKKNLGRPCHLRFRF